MIPSFVLGLKNVGLFASLPSQKARTVLRHKMQECGPENCRAEPAVNCVANKGPKSWIRQKKFSVIWGNRFFQTIF